MNKIKVMHIQFWNDVCLLQGSVDTVISSFAKLSDFGVDICIGSRGKRCNAEINGAPVYYFYEDRFKNKVLNKILGLKVYTYSELTKLVNNLRPDILHFHNRHEFADAIMPALRFSPRPKVVCHYHRRFDYYKIPKAANLLIAVSSALLADMIAARSPAVPIEILHNPIDIPQDRSEKEVLGSQSKPRLLYGGGYQQIKGFFELESVLRTEIANLYEIILCGPNFSNYVPDFPATVLGKLSSIDFQHQLKIADVVVVPSHFEGFGLVAAEAMALGKLVIGTRGGGLADILDESNSISLTCKTLQCFL